MNSSIKPIGTTWQKFRAHLFDTMEKRRAIVSSYAIRDMFFFISDCKPMHNRPGTKEAREALTDIKENGSFRFVADTLTEFLAMFPDAERGESDQTEIHETLENTAPASAGYKHHGPSARPQSGRPFRPGETEATHE